MNRALPGPESREKPFLKLVKVFLEVATVVLYKKDGGRETEDADNNHLDIQQNKQ